MSTMTEKMSQAGTGKPVTKGGAGPKKGDRYRCETCGMEVRVGADCRCGDPDHAHFHCCGQSLRKM